MDYKAVANFCKELGCCDACCLRYLGIHKPAAYENSQQYMLKYQDKPSEDNKGQEQLKTDEESTRSSENGGTDHNGSSSPPAKRKKTEICISCLGILQENSWSESCEMVKEQLDKKRYECAKFACALSAPIATIVREKYIMLSIAEKFTAYDGKSVTPLKEAWKWSFGTYLSKQINKILDSGAVCPLLVTVTIEYADEAQELEILKTISPALFESRSKQKRRFTVEFTRRSVEEALEDVRVDVIKERGGVNVPAVRGRCVSVMCQHTPLYLGGRYIKLSRTLPQTQWLVDGKRMMDSSVQEIIFEPIAKLYNMSPEESEHRLKFMSAGREDVDVRCLGDGRPFAVEISDPSRELNKQELENVCEEINKSGSVVVKQFVYVSREDLSLLKKGEQSKAKTYEALCIKLTHTDDDVNKEGPPTVTQTDIDNINNYRNMPESSDARVVIQQRTPIRVLHRRPLLVRTRHLYQLEADFVPGHPQMYTVRMSTEAGTYMKEWVGGDCGRTAPSLAAALRARTDILALDVTRVHLAWPNK